MYHNFSKLWYFVKNQKIHPSWLYLIFRSNCTMAEAGMAAYSSAIGVAIALAIITFALRGKGHPDPAE